MFHRSAVILSFMLLSRDLFHLMPWMWCGLLCLIWDVLMFSLKDRLRRGQMRPLGRVHVESMCQETSFILVTRKVAFVAGSPVAVRKVRSWSKESHCFSVECLICDIWNRLCVWCQRLARFQFCTKALASFLAHTNCLLCPRSVLILGPDCGTENKMRKFRFNNYPCAIVFASLRRQRWRPHTQIFLCVSCSFRFWSEKSDCHSTTTLDNLVALANWLVVNILFVYYLATAKAWLSTDRSILCVFSLIQLSMTWCVRFFFHFWIQISRAIDQIWSPVPATRTEPSLWDPCQAD